MHSFPEADNKGQWSSKGNDVHLIDAQEKPLVEAVRSIRELQRKSERIGAGAVIKHLLPDLRQALDDVWLVVEVPEILKDDT